MIILAGFPVLEPTLGLMFWMAVIFLLTWIILGKFAFKPITQAIRDRENSIDSAIKSADRARAEVANLKAENEELLKQAKEERTQILKEANTIKAQIIEEAKADAKKEASKIIENTRMEVNSMKVKAVNEVKQDVGDIAIEIAEKLVRQKLAGGDSQKQLISSLIEEANFNLN